MKLGQLLSLEGDDFLPPEVSEALALLRADADAMPEEQLEAALADSYGRDWRARFLRFDPERLVTEVQNNRGVPYIKALLVLDRA